MSDRSVFKSRVSVTVGLSDSGGGGAGLIILYTPWHTTSLVWATRGGSKSMLQS